MHYFLIALLLTACSAERQPEDLFGPVEEETELVVDAALLVDRTLPELFVRRTLPPGRVYSREKAAVTEARVRVLQGDQVYEYAADEAAPGRYLPPRQAPLVEALTEYRLEVDVEGKKVRASTTTPERVRVRRAVLIDEETLEISRTLKSFAEADLNVGSFDAAAFIRCLKLRPLAARSVARSRRIVRASSKWGVGLW